MGFFEGPTDAYCEDAFERMGVSFKINNVMTALPIALR